MHEIDENLFRVLAHDAAEHASSSLTALTKKIAFVKPKRVSYSSKPIKLSLANSKQAEHYLIEIAVQGETPGVCLIFFDKTSGDALSNHLLSSINEKNADPLLASSALKETANILLGAFLTVMSNRLNLKIIEHLPCLSLFESHSALKTHIETCTNQKPGEEVCQIEVDFNFLDETISGHMLVSLAELDIKRANFTDNQPIEKSNIQAQLKTLVLAGNVAMFAAKTSDLFHGIAKQYHINKYKNLVAVSNAVLSNATCLIIASKQLLQKDKMQLEFILRTHPHLPVILMCQNLDEDTEKILYNLGLAAYLSAQEINAKQLKHSIIHAIKRHIGWHHLYHSELKYKTFYHDIISGKLSTVYAPNSPSQYLEIRESQLLSENEELISKLQHAAHYDYLTDIPNRKYFEQELSKQINRAKRSSELFYLCLIDIDHFKTINDTRGHDFGDELLKQVSLRIQKAIRGMDTYARLGGDEFALILSNPKEIKNPTIIAQRLLKQLTKPYTLFNKKINVTFSMGFSEYNQEFVSSYTVLMKHADLALYQSKESGRNQYNFYAIDLAQLKKRQNQIESALQSGLYKKELYMVYQPIINLETNEISHFEALVRWQSSSLNDQIAPDEFVKIAENSGQIIGLSQYILHCVCADIKMLQKKSTNPPPVAINFSSIDLMSEHFAQRLDKTIKSYGLGPANIQTELTETAVMENHDIIQTTIIELRKLDYKISIDDFGTGYSSLSRLRDLKFDTVKIDKSFIANMVSDTNSLSIVRALLELTKQLGIVSIAEGIEQKQEANLLRKWGCKYGQGYYFSKPLLKDELPFLIKKHNGEQQEQSKNLPAMIFKKATKIRRIIHDINNKLAGLLGYAEILLHKQSLGGDIYNIIHAIHTAVDEAADNMMQFSQEIQYIQHHDAQTLAMYHQMAEITQTHAKQLLHANIQIEYSVHPLIETLKQTNHPNVEIENKLQRMAELLVALKSLNTELLNQNLGSASKNR